MPNSCLPKQSASAIMSSMSNNVNSHDKLYEILRLLPLAFSVKMALGCKLMNVRH